MTGARRLVAVGLGTLMLGVPGLACGGGGGSSASSVDVFDFGFGPKQLTVGPDTEVTWENTGSTVHTVKGKGFFSKAIDPGGSYQFRFSQPGTYDYVCTLHPQMKATVLVEK